MNLEKEEYIPNNVFPKIENIKLHLRYVQYCIKSKYSFMASGKLQFCGIWLLPSFQALVVLTPNIILFLYLSVARAVVSSCNLRYGSFVTRTHRKDANAA